MIRQIGTQSREELEATLGSKVFLELHVLVREEWRENPRFLADLDWRKEVDF
jgi:GTP-binding protein Era